MVNKEEKAIYDKLQTKLTPQGIAPNTFKYAKKSISETIGQKMLLCPFCLEHYYYWQFKYDKGFYECKHCKNLMKGSTLVLMFEVFNKELIDAEKYAKFVYGYRTSGFFKKINFKEWCEKLHYWNISFEFWNEYKKLKGEQQNNQNSKLKELGYYE